VTGSPAVELTRISKRFAGVRALEDVSVSVTAGEIHSIVGENGAGKSTLLNVLTGLIRPDAGTIRMGGREVTLRGPRDARAHGISFVPQEVRVVPGLSAGRNATLGLEPRFAPRLQLRRSERERASTALRRAGATYPVERQAFTLSVPELRLCQIARALAHLGDVLVLDEPTAAVSEHDAEHLLGRLEALRDDGEAIMYVSHRLSEVLRVSDRITVLRDGRVVGTFARGELNRDELVSLMAKQARGNGEPAAIPAMSPHGERVLEAVALWSGRTLRGVSLAADRGQIVGIAGVQGSGHGELLHVLAGARAADSGSVRAFRVELPSGSVRAAAAAGIALIPADRRRAAIVGPRSVRDNIVLPARGVTGRFGVRAARAERRLARRYVDALDVRPRALGALVATLSGGNQQKVALARALASDARILLLEEPTQGIDVHAKSEIKRLIRGLAAEGRTVMFSPSEVAELTELADVVHVMRLGELRASLEGAEATYETLLRHALP
jgi:ABC-type sugar transport system ATPase subunit